MALRITCPGCKTALRFEDEMRGHKVRCENCDKVLSIPGGNGKKPRGDEAGIQEGVKRKAAADDAEEDRDDQEEEAAPRKKKKKKKKKSSSMGLIIGAGAGVFVLLLVIGGVSAMYFMRGDDPNKAKGAQVAQNKDKKAPDGGANGQENPGGDKKEEPVPFRIAPKIQEGSPTKKGGTGIVQNVRGAVYRTERKSELMQLRTAYIMFCDDYKGAARTRENFLTHINTFGPIRDAVKDGYYQINLKARQDGDNVIAYERDEDAQGHLCVRANGDLVYVRSAQLKKELGIP